MLRDYEDLICDIRDEALLDCSGDFSIDLQNVYPCLDERFNKTVNERLEELRGYNNEAEYDSEKTPVDDIELVLDKCGMIFSDKYEEAIEAALDAAERVFNEKIEQIADDMQEVIDDELYGNPKAMNT